MSHESPNVVLLTPPGRGAVATLLVAGHGAVAAVDPLFRARGAQPLASHPTDRIVVGHFGDDPGTAEEIVARRVSDEEVLLHCHGGTAAVARIESLLTDRGVLPRNWPDWAADTHADPLQAEAMVALAKATTERAAGVLLDQYHGALRARLNEILAALTAGDSATAAREIDRLLARASLGLHLTAPWKVVLAGPPNSGKSSLVNALVGYSRAIVHAAPGTTRDVLTAETSIDGWPVVLVDTAGLRESDHPVEAEGVRRAREQLAAADLVLLVFDASRRGADEDVHDAYGLGSRPTLVIRNKSDLLATPPGRPEGLLTSALTGQGIPGLLRALANRLLPDPPIPGEPMPWTRRQVDHLVSARAELVRGNAVPAARRLENL